MPTIPAISDLETVFRSLLSVILAGTGITVLIMFVVGGIKFLTAGGDKEATQKAQNTLTYALVGLIVVLSAWVILSYLGSFLGITFNTFKICLPGNNASGMVGGGCN